MNVSWNGFAKKGAHALGDALSRNDRLEELDLRCNRITQEAAADIIKGLHGNTTLKSLRVRLPNLIGDLFKLVDKPGI